jgi:hypothetical protein
MSGHISYTFQVGKETPVPITAGSTLTLREVRGHKYVIEFEATQLIHVTLLPDTEATDHDV